MPMNSVFNADEFGLFCRCLPDKSLHLKNEKCIGGKHSKVRLAGMAAVNAKGERLSMFVIGESKSSRYFKGVKNIPCCYRAQPKRWMSAELFKEWVKEIDLKFSFQKRKIALIVDNCSAHPNMHKIDCVELIFLPPNTTSITQPMDQGVIRSLKAKYRSLAVKKQTATLIKENKMLKFSILTAMFMLTKAWNSIPDQAFINCFKKLGTSLEAVEKHVNDDNDLFCGLDVDKTVMENLRDDLELLKTKFDADFYLTVEELVDIDFDVCIANKSSDEDIIAEVSEHDAIETEEESDDECVGVSDNATKPI
ncbi:tigger transposable element-derived protein 4-like [Hydra vulgaris]|uniref:Tigger transposable element-derived protein 4-like n=1 Tax=Hydra vulgaris TaxID=6087 RepID=A0ABM4D1C7_HYDVU